MQQLILLALFVAALYYLYRKLIKNRGCNCSGKSCSTPPILPKKEEEKDQ